MKHIPIINGIFDALQTRSEIEVPLSILHRQWRKSATPPLDSFEDYLAKVKMATEATSLEVNEQTDRVLIRKRDFCKP
jgi:hypothetical protein